MTSCIAMCLHPDYHVIFYVLFESDYDAVILGTVYLLETKPVTLNTYEKSPNDKAYEFYLDSRVNVEQSVSEDDLDVHLEIFKNSIEACRLANIKHITVIETPLTKKGNSKPFSEILDKAGIPFTYIKASGDLENTPSYTFEEGVVSDLNIQGFAFADDYMSKNGYSPGDWSKSLDEEVKGTKNKNIPREDLAAVAVQSLISLDWGTTRCINVSSNGKNQNKSVSDGKYKYKTLKSDKDWLLQSEIIAEKVRLLK